MAPRCTTAAAPASTAATASRRSPTRGITGCRRPWHARRGATGRAGARDRPISRRPAPAGSRPQLRVRRPRATSTSRIAAAPCTVPGLRGDRAAQPDGGDSPSPGPGRISGAVTRQGRQFPSHPAAGCRDSPPSLPRRDQAAPRSLRLTALSSCPFRRSPLPARRCGCAACASGRARTRRRRRTAAAIDSAGLDGGELVRPVVVGGRTAESGEVYPSRLIEPVRLRDVAVSSACQISTTASGTASPAPSYTCRERMRRQGSGRRAAHPRRRARESVERADGLLGVWTNSLGSADWLTRPHRPVRSRLLCDRSARCPNGTPAPTRGCSGRGRTAATRLSGPPGRGSTGRSGQREQRVPGKYIWVTMRCVNSLPNTEKWMCAGRQAFGGCATGTRLA